MVLTEREEIVWNALRVKANIDELNNYIRVCLDDLKRRVDYIEENPKRCIMCGWMYEEGKRNNTV